MGICQRRVVSEAGRMMMRQIRAERRAARDELGARVAQIAVNGDVAFVAAQAFCRRSGRIGQIQRQDAVRNNVSNGRGKVVVPRWPIVAGHTGLISRIEPRAVREVMRRTCRLVVTTVTRRHKVKNVVQVRTMTIGAVVGIGVEQAGLVPHSLHHDVVVRGRTCRPRIVPLLVMTLIAGRANPAVQGWTMAISTMIGIRIFLVLRVQKASLIGIVDRDARCGEGRNRPQRGLGTVEVVVEVANEAGAVLAPPSC